MLYGISTTTTPSMTSEGKCITWVLTKHDRRVRLSSSWTITMTWMSTIHWLEHRSLRIRLWMSIFQGTASSALSTYSLCSMVGLCSNTKFMTSLDFSVVIIARYVEHGFINMEVWKSQQQWMWMDTLGSMINQGASKIMNGIISITGTLGIGSGTTLMKVLSGSELRITMHGMLL